eukprot:7098681-Lingulodinium_polyedra.AAC.1
MDKLAAIPSMQYHELKDNLDVDKPVIAGMGEEMSKALFEDGGVCYAALVDFKADLLRQTRDN